MCSETCLPWQGRVYINDVFVMWEGKIEQRNEILYGKSNYCRKWFPILSSAIHGGLFHPNCRHKLIMWRDGDPIPQPVDNSKNNRRYKLEQHQRLLENNVRKAKRFIAGQTDPSNIRKAKAELINAQKRLREFIQQTNISENETVLKRDYGKEKIYQNENLQNGLTYANTEDIINIRSSGKVPITDSNDNYCELIGKIDYNDKKAVAKSLMEFEGKYKSSDIEHCRVITISGEVFEVHGGKYTVDPSILGDKLRGSINEHNHVTGESQYSFSYEDLKSSIADGSKMSMAFDEKYRYSMLFSDKIISEDDLYNAYEASINEVGNARIFKTEIITDEDVQHQIVKRTCEKVGIKYGRIAKRITD